MAWSVSFSSRPLKRAGCKGRRQCGDLRRTGKDGGSTEAAKNLKQPWKMTLIPQMQFPLF